MSDLESIPVKLVGNLCMFSHPKYYPRLWLSNRWFSHCSVAVFEIKIFTQTSKKKNKKKNLCTIIWQAPKQNTPWYSFQNTCHTHWKRLYSKILLKHNLPLHQHIGKRLVLARKGECLTTFQCNIEGGVWHQHVALHWTQTASVGENHLFLYLDSCKLVIPHIHSCSSRQVLAGKLQKSKLDQTLGVI